MSWVLLIVICTSGVFSGECSTPIVAAEYGSLESCKTAADGAEYTIRRQGWKPFNDGAVCVQRSTTVRP